MFLPCIGRLPTCLSLTRPRTQTWRVGTCLTCPKPCPAESLRAALESESTRNVTSTPLTGSKLWSDSFDAVPFMRPYHSVSQLNNLIVHCTFFRCFAVCLSSIVEHSSLSMHTPHGLSTFTLKQNMFGFRNTLTVIWYL